VSWAGRIVGRATPQKAGLAANPGPPARSEGCFIEAEGLSFAYAEGDRRVVALADVSLRLERAACSALLGPTGSGKSTLLFLLRGLLEPDAGAVHIDGLAPGDAAFAAAQRSVGVVFQQAERQLFAISAREDVAFGPRQLGWGDDAVDAAVTDALDVVGLPEDRFGDRHPYSLSGGEQRRLALAGVLAMRPRALLLDEPFVGLDPGARRDLAATVGRLRDGGRTILLATHDVDQAWALCDERIVLAGGRVAAAGEWSFDAEGVSVLEANRLRVPSLVGLWQRLGRPAGEAPRTAAAAAEALL
jgi:energy-coupling factor transport system ATP-binding protein